MDIERAHSLLAKALRVMGPTACEDNVEVRKEIGNYLATNCPNGVDGWCPLCGGAGMIQEDLADGVHTEQCPFCKGDKEIRPFTQPAQEVANEMAKGHLAERLPADVAADANAREPSWETKAGAPPPPKEPSRHFKAAHPIKRPTKGKKKLR